MVKKAPVKIEENQDVEYSDQEEGEIPEIPKEQRIILTQPYDKSVSDLVSMMKNKDITLDPDYQRNYIWKDDKASLLIESILLSVPIPVVYVSEETDGHWTVIDGLQRLYSIYRFAQDEFKLIGLEVFTDLNGMTCSELNPKAARIFRNGIIRIIVLLHGTHPDIKYDIFLRLNRGSVTLNEQELRNCLYHGKFNDMLKELRKYPKFLDCLRFSGPHKRFNDAELALRYFALSEYYDKKNNKINNYQNKMRSFLNHYMNSKMKLSEKEKKLLENKFKETIKKVYVVFGKNAFRRVDSQGNVEGRMNRALMDVIMLGFESISTDKLKKAKSKILKLYKELPNKNKKFNNCITFGTNDASKIEYRIKTWLKKQSEVIS